MSRPARAHPRDLPESRFLASRIQDAKRRGMTNREIGTAFGINERTVRKIRSGETPGTVVYARHIPKEIKQGASPSIVRVDIEIGYEIVGGKREPVIRTINAKVPTLPTASGKRVAPTAFDVFRMPNLSQVAAAEAQAMQRRYLGTLTNPTEPRVTSIRPIARRNPSTVLHTITGMMR